MTNRNKEIVRRLNRAFEANDIDGILLCLADDVRWNVQGAFTANGKKEYREQVLKLDFAGRATIIIKNEIAEGDNIAVEGSIETKLNNGEMLNAFFHNTYRLEKDKIKTMTTYFVPKTDASSF